MAESSPAAPHDGASAPGGGERERRRPSPDLGIATPAVGAFTEARRAREHHLATAAQEAHLGSVVNPEAKLPLARKALAKAARPVTAFQMAFNEELLEAFRLLDEELELRHDQVFQSVRSLGDAVEDMYGVAAALGDRVDATERRHAQLSDMHAELLAAVQGLRSEVAGLRARIDLALAAIEDLAAGRER